MVEYKAEAFKLFEGLMDSIDYEVVHRIYKIQVQPQEQAAVSRVQGTEKKEQITNPVEDNLSPTPSALNPTKKIGRNDPCPCGSGLKWKKCGLINAPQHKG